MGAFTEELGITVESLMNAGRFDPATGQLNQTSRIDSEKATATLKRIHEGVLDLLSHGGQVKQFLGHVKADGILLKGLVFGGRGLSLPSYIAADPEGESIIPGAIARIEYMDPPLVHPIVLRAAYFKQDESGYKLYILPYAPDIENPDKPGDLHPTAEDIIRTLRVVKATNRNEDNPNGQLELVWDGERDNFVFLPNPEKPSDVLRYPKGEQYGEFSNQPIAFVRDLNATSHGEKAGTINTWLNKPEVKPVFKPGVNLNPDADMTALNMKDIIPAPDGCLEACTQQYVHTTILAETLDRHGIKMNVEIPAPGSLELNSARGFSYATGPDHTPTLIA